MFNLNTNDWKKLVIVSFKKLNKQKTVLVNTFFFGKFKCLSQVLTCNIHFAASRWRRRTKEEAVDGTGHNKRNLQRFHLQGSISSRYFSFFLQMFTIIDISVQNV